MPTKTSILISEKPRKASLTVIAEVKNLQDLVTMA
jgi:hypothetical protein